MEVCIDSAQSDTVLEDKFDKCQSSWLNQLSNQEKQKAKENMRRRYEQISL
jgi:hypothetical protein